MAGRARGGAATGSGDATRASPGELTSGRWRRPVQWADRAQTPCTCRRRPPMLGSVVADRLVAGERHARRHDPRRRLASVARRGRAPQARRRSRLSGVGGGVAAHPGQGAEGDTARTRSCFSCTRARRLSSPAPRGALLLSCTKASVAELRRQTLARDDLRAPDRRCVDACFAPGGAGVTGGRSCAHGARSRLASAEGRLRRPSVARRRASVATRDRRRLATALHVERRRASKHSSWPRAEAAGLRRRMVAFLSANDERDAREAYGSRAVCQELGESPGGESRRPNGVRVSGCTECEGDR